MNTHVDVAWRFSTHRISRHGNASQIVLIDISRGKLRETHIMQKGPEVLDLFTNLTSGHIFSLRCRKINGILTTGFPGYRTVIQHKNIRVTIHSVWATSVCVTSPIRIHPVPNRHMWQTRTLNIFAELGICKRQIGARHIDQVSKTTNDVTVVSVESAIRRRVTILFIFFSQEQSSIKMPQEHVRWRGFSDWWHFVMAFCAQPCSCPPTPPVWQCAPPAWSSHCAPSAGRCVLPPLFSVLSSVLCSHFVLEIGSHRTRWGRGWICPSVCCRGQGGSAITGIWVPMETEKKVFQRLADQVSSLGWDLIYPNQLMGLKKRNALGASSLPNPLLQTLFQSSLSEGQSPQG
jgi:hypothetical protein